MIKGFHADLPMIEENDEIFHSILDEEDEGEEQKEEAKEHPKK